MTFADSNNDGIFDNPELFDLIVDPKVNPSLKYVFFQDTFTYDNFVSLASVDNATVETQLATLRDIEINKTLYQSGQLFYIPTTNKFYQLSISGSNYIINEVTGYTAKIGRQGIYFQYRHNTPNYKRIDPSPNNLIDLYILTKQYATDYTAWLRDTTGKIVEPTAPTGEDLSSAYSTLENYKNISDSLVYNPVKFKPIFGSKADQNLQAQFKVVKNPYVIVSDNDIKTSVINAINRYFDIENWDFGETFYFSELAAYLHNQLQPNISSIMIVPSNTNNQFGSLLQINAEYNEIIQSAATVNDVVIIPAITAAQINQSGTIVVG